MSIRYRSIDPLLPHLLLLLLVILIATHLWDISLNYIMVPVLYWTSLWLGDECEPLKWLKSTPLKRAQHISRISFISVASYISSGKERIHHVTGQPIMKQLDFLSHHNGVLSFFRLKRSPGAAWQDKLSMDTNSLYLCFLKEYTRRSVRWPFQAVDDNDECVADELEMLVVHET